MLRTEHDLRYIENSFLAPYATHAKEKSTRRIPEKSHPFRTDFQRDRDRILHSKAFRRLEYKTQVFLSGSGDHLRNRLTHTIEVTAIARTIARALGLNEDLTEVIALSHDLGHSPYGHAGERALHHQMKDHGGFDHNLQALRIVDYLELKYPEYDGLNLSWEVRSGLLKHRSHGQQLDGIVLPPQPSLEAQVADLADDITYYGHDTDDGLDSGLIKAEQLKDLEIWQEALENARLVDPGVTGTRLEDYAIRCLINSMVGNAIKTSAELLQKYKPGSAEEAENLDRPLISLSEDFQKKTLALKGFLYQNLYFGPALHFLNEHSFTHLNFLFQYFLENPQEMGSFAQKRIEQSGIYRTVTDYIAGMTDNFANREFERLQK